MDQLDPKVKKALFAIQKDLLMNVSAHQALMKKLEILTDEFDKNAVIEHKKEVEHKIKLLDHKQKKLLAAIRGKKSAKPSENQKIEETPSSPFNSQPQEEAPPKLQPEEENPTSPHKLLKKEEKPSSPHKLINYKTKRPREEELGSEHFKKRKTDKKAYLFGPSEKVEEKDKIFAENCFSEEEEAKLRAYGCFYVFAYQTKLTRPITEQDYFLMNFGLVSRDHIQYAPFDVACNVRRTRRQAGSRPKYKASEWEMTSAKRFKLSKGKVKEGDQNVDAEESSTKLNELGNALNNHSDLNPSCDNTVSIDAETPEIVSSENCRDIENEASKLTNDKQVESSGFSSISAKLTDEKQAACVSATETTPASLSQKIESVTKEKKEVKTEVKESLSTAFDVNQVSKFSRNVPEISKSEAPRENRRKAKKEKIRIDPDEQKYTSINRNRRRLFNEHTNDILFEMEGSGLFQNCLNGAKFPREDKDFLQCDNSVENSDLAEANDRISSQDSGISMRSDVSRTEMNSCSNLEFPSMSQGSMDDNNSSNDSASLEPDFLLPDRVLREQINII